MRITLSSKSIESKCTLTEPIYETKYNFEKFSNEIVQMFVNPNLIGISTQLDLPL